MPRSRVALSWSSGKDSAWALHLLRQDPGVEVVALVTTLNQQFDRVAMHAVRRELLELQAAAIGLPLWTVPLPWPCSNEDYETRMRDLCARAIGERVDAMAFGDLFLADIRAYRERQLAGTGLRPLFPVWQLPTGQLAAEMLAAGLKAKITCVDPKGPAEGICRPGIRHPIPDGFAAERRSVRRKRRVSLVRIRWPRICGPVGRKGGRNRGAGWLRFRGSYPCQSGLMVLC